MTRCHHCQARLNGETACPRCHADLRLVLAVAADAEAALRRGVSCLAQGEPTQAQNALRTSLTLRRTPLATYLLDFMAEIK